LRVSDKKLCLMLEVVLIGVYVNTGLTVLFGSVLVYLLVQGRRI
jgi:hypothetical protein